ncbi:MAG TPA: hypothetical protein ENI95_14720 [Chloroflexi bacterium]|nr:hypothetical protein [Chloroflexota bacterium]
MNLINRIVHRQRRIRLLGLIGLALVLALAVSACNALPGGGGGEEVIPRQGEEEEPLNPIPTPLPAEDVGGEAISAAQDTPEGTWENYLRDMIAEQVSDRQQKLRLLERYQDPDITQQNLGGLVEDIDLVEDRTEFTISSGTATADAEFDIRLHYANGDTDTRTCRLNVGMEFDEEDGVWYVLNPAPLQIFSVCN